MVPADSFGLGHDFSRPSPVGGADADHFSVGSPKTHDVGLAEHRFSGKEQLRQVLHLPAPSPSPPLECSLQIDNPYRAVPVAVNKQMNQITILMGEACGVHASDQLGGLDDESATGRYFQFRIGEQIGKADIVDQSKCQGE